MFAQGLHICHVSLLNPAIHSRIFFKMARSQVAAGYRVSIIAQDAATAPYERDGVQIIPIGVFGRMSWRRIWAVRKIRRLAAALAADLYQLHTVELLPMAEQLKRMLPRAKVVYDMHEDYISNILHAEYYGEWSRKPLANRVKSAQDAFSRWGDGLILAEDCFQGLLAFKPDYTAVVRNKYQAPAAALGAPKLGPAGLPFMLVTGTIAENWGVLKAIQLWEQLNRIAPLGLVIAGHGHDAQLLADVHWQVNAAGLGDRFLLAGGSQYLPFEEVVMFIQACTFGVALYTLQENIKDRIPTKFYEFMAHRKPLLFTANPAWDALNAELDFGMSVNGPLDEATENRIYDAFVNGQGHFYRKSMPDAAWSWQPEGQSMLNLIQKILR